MKLNESARMWNQITLPAGCDTCAAEISRAEFRSPTSGGWARADANGLRRGGGAFRAALMAKLGEEGFLLERRAPPQ